MRSAPKSSDGFISILKYVLVEGSAVLRVEFWCRQYILGAVGEDESNILVKDTSLIFLSSIILIHVGTQCISNILVSSIRIADV